MFKFMLKIHQNVFGGQALPRSAGEPRAPPDQPGGFRGKDPRVTERKEGKD